MLTTYREENFLCVQSKTGGDDENEKKKKSVFIMVFNLIKFVARSIGSDSFL